MTIKPGDKFGNLTAIKPLKGGKFWQCSCACGGQTKASKWHLLRGLRQACSCRKKPQQSEIQCDWCGEVKPRSDFYTRIDGTLHQAVCKSCMRNHVSKSSKNRSIQDRLTALKRFGGDPPRCQCCSESNIEFLCLDHINNDGKAHREEIRKSGKRNIYQWLRLINYNTSIQLRVLCCNCNSSMAAYGYCPHQKQRQ